MGWCEPGYGSTPVATPSSAAETTPCLGAVRGCVLSRDSDSRPSCSRSPLSLQGPRTSLSLGPGIQTSAGKGAPKVRRGHFCQRTMKRNLGNATSTTTDDVPDPLARAVRRRPPHGPGLRRGPSGLLARPRGAGELRARLLERRRPTPQAAAPGALRESRSLKRVQSAPEASRDIHQSTGRVLKHLVPERGHRVAGSSGGPRALRVPSSRRVEAHPEGGRPPSHEPVDVRGGERRGGPAPTRTTRGCTTAIWRASACTTAEWEGTAHTEAGRRGRRWRCAPGRCTCKLRGGATVVMRLADILLGDGEHLLPTIRRRPPGVGCRRTDRPGESRRRRWPRIPSRRPLIKKWTAAL